jgi:nitrous oxidase accessory protein
MKRMLGVKAVLILLAIVGCSSDSNAETLNVGQDNQARFSSITAAIRAARPGDTILIGQGTYVEQVVLDKTLTLEGVNKPVVRGSGRGSVIIVLAPACTIRGIVVQHCGSELQNEDSGILLKSRGNRVEDNELSDVLFGIYLFQSAENTIRGNTIRGRKNLDTGDRGAGLHFYSSPDNTIEDNVVTEERDGMYIQNSPGNKIRRNRVSNLRYGLHYMYSDANVFEDNVFSNNMAGAAIMYSNRIVFRRNAFIHNRGYSSFGILFQDCNDCIAEGNFIIDNSVGLFMEAIRRSAFRNNVIAGNDVAIEMFASAADNVFAENNFVENISPLHLVGRTTTTRWASEGRGNFWSDYDGYDLDGDGVGDVPHKVQNVFEYMEGNHPRLRLYLLSPAAQALAVAEKTLPVVRGSSEADPAPLVKATEIKFPFAERKTGRTERVPLLLVSLFMVGAGLLLVVSAQRRAG